MTFMTEDFTDAESAIQFLTSHGVPAAAANWVAEHHADFTAPWLGVRMSWKDGTWRGEAASYKIRRVYQSLDIQAKPIVRRGLSHAMAMAHCENPETSSETATDPVKRARTSRLGGWMECFYGEDNWVTEQALNNLRNRNPRGRYWVNGEAVRNITRHGPVKDEDDEEEG